MDINDGSNIHSFPVYLNASHEPEGNIQQRIPWFNLPSYRFQLSPCDSHDAAEKPPVLQPIMNSGPCTSKHPASTTATSLPYADTQGTRRPRHGQA